MVSPPEGHYGLAGLDIKNIHLTGRAIHTTCDNKAKLKRSVYAENWSEEKTVR